MRAAPKAPPSGRPAPDARSPREIKTRQPRPHPLPLKGSHPSVGHPPVDRSPRSRKQSFEVLRTPPHHGSIRWPERQATCRHQPEGLCLAFVYLRVTERSRIEHSWRIDNAEKPFGSLGMLLAAIVSILRAKVNRRGGRQFPLPEYGVELRCVGGIWKEYCMPGERKALRLGLKRPGEGRQRASAGRNAPCRLLSGKAKKSRRKRPRDRH